MKSTIHRFNLTCLTVVVMIMVTACVCDSTPVIPNGNNTSMNTPTSFQLHIVKTVWSPPNIENFRTSQKKAFLQDSLVIIYPRDIETYDWSQQTLMLTEERSSELKKEFDKLSPIGVHLITLDKHGFYVVFNDNWLYAGLFTERGSAMGHRHPVIYLDETEDSKQIILSIRPVHPVFEYEEVDPTLKETIEIPEVHDYFLELGNLVE